MAPLRPLTRPLALGGLAVVIFVLAIASNSLHQASGSAIRGDTDCSGVVDDHDAILLLLALAGEPGTQPQECAATGSPASSSDANCDRAIDLRDALDTLRLAAGLDAGPCLATTLGRGATAATIGPEGGTLAATATDGASYTLTIPPDALTGPQLIQMTPIASITSLPLNGGFVAGVELQPSGLLFWIPVVLTIAPADEIPTGQETAFMISHGEFSLAAPLPEAGPIQIVIPHFSEVGVGSGTSTDRQAAGQSTADAGSAFQSQAADLLQQERQALLEGRAGNPQLTQQLLQLAQQYYDTAIAPNLSRAAQDCDFGRSFMPKALGWMRQMELLGLGETFENQFKAIGDTLIAGLVNCYNEASQRCQNHDLTGIPDMLSYLRSLALLGAEDEVDADKIDACAHFRLEFESEICVTGTGDNCGPYGTYTHYKAGNMEWGGILPGAPQAEGPLTLIDGKVVTSCATWSVTTPGSLFQVVSGGVYLNQIDESGMLQSPEVSIVIAPHKPPEHWTFDCDGEPGQEDNAFWWYKFCPLHHDEIVAPPFLDPEPCLYHDPYEAGNAEFNIRNWELVGNALYATKTYERNYTNIGAFDRGWERTTLKLYHLPE